MDEITFIYEIEEEKMLEFEEIFKKLLLETKKLLKLDKNLVFSLNFISSEKSKMINKEYRGKNYVGDVISFPIDDPLGIYEQLEFKEIGDIFISPEEAENKALKYKHTFFEEICWLFVHGLLHILGFDHETDEKKATQMFSLTDKILNIVNVSYKIV